MNGAVAGVIAAGAWAVQQPLDKLIFRSRYDDVELLGKAVTQGRWWRPLGLAMHLANGAAFGAVYAPLRTRLRVPPRRAGVAAGLAEHLALWPLVRITDRLHPARHELEPLAGNRAAFAQAVWRHVLFGFLLGTLEAGRPEPCPRPPRRRKRPANR